MHRRAAGSRRARQQHLAHEGVVEGEPAGVVGVLLDEPDPQRHRERVEQRLWGELGQRAEYLEVERRTQDRRLQQHVLRTIG